MIKDTETDAYQDGDAVILADKSHHASINNDWFEPSYWHKHGLLDAYENKRGAPCFMQTPLGDGVLRHYRRGGLVAKCIHDRYLWQGHKRVRSVLEYDLLKKLWALDLPVPEPIAARYIRHGAVYTADIITQRIFGIQTVGDMLQKHTLTSQLMQALGRMVARFHHYGVWHADLNANNLLVSEHRLYMIDFDRAKIRKIDPQWQWSNIARLRRSLVKLGALNEGEEAFLSDLWQPFLYGYGHH